MEFLQTNREGIAWILLWIWIALTIFIFAYNRPKPVMVYLVNLAILAGWIYLFFWK